MKMKLGKIFLSIAVVSTLMMAAGDAGSYGKYNKDVDLKDCSTDRSVCKKECNKNKKLYSNINTCYSICEKNYKACAGMAYEEEKLYTKE